MNAEKFFSEMSRMCNTYACQECPLYHMRCQGHMELEDRLKVLRIVEEWGKEHPPLTNKKKFEEVFGFPISAIRDVRYLSQEWLDAEYKEPKHGK